MALTPTEEALVRDLIAQEDELLSLAANEPTIISKLGATKVTLSDLMAASAGDLTDLFLTRQGTDDRSMTMEILRGFMMQNGVTAPQFDNDTSLATTEFVQRALGNLAGVYTAPAGSYTLTAGHIGKYTQPNDGAVITLPTPISIGAPIGSMTTFILGARINVSVAVGAGANLLNGMSLVSSLALGEGDAVSFVAMGFDTWALMNPLGNTDKYRAALLLNGYQKLPSGLIIQWRQITLSVSQTATFTFPIAFPNQVWAILSTPSSIPYTAASTPGHAVRALNVTQFEAQNFYSQSGSSGTVLAIGH